MQLPAIELTQSAVDETYRKNKDRREYKSTRAHLARSLTSEAPDFQFLSTDTLTDFAEGAVELRPKSDVHVANTDVGANCKQ